MDIVTCPTCKKEVKWDLKSPYCPFCCERCKLIDIGAWASNAYAIPDETIDPDDFIKDIDTEREGEDSRDDE